MEPVVELRSAVAMLGRFPALAGLDLTVSRGEIVLLRGANGAGKTTLLRLCCGLERLERGSGRVLGFNLATQRRQLRPNTGLLAHQTFLYDDLTALDNVSFWAAATRSGREAAGQAMETVGLEPRLAGVAVRGLSAGQRRRVSVAAMIVRRPMLWLLDEPHAGLDSDGRDMIDGLIESAAASGATVMMASHELDRAESVASRIIEISGGSVIADGLEPSTGPADGSSPEPSLGEPRR